MWFIIALFLITWETLQCPSTGDGLINKPRTSKKKGTLLSNKREQTMDTQDGKGWISKTSCKIKKAGTKDWWNTCDSK